MVRIMSRKMWIASLTVAALGASGLAAVGAGAPLSPRAGGGGHAAQGYLGVELRDPSSKELAEQHPGVVHCTEIVRVDHDGPAGKAGLREHDLILQMNGRAVGGQEQLKHMLHDTAPGQAVTMLILREGQQMTVSAQVADREEVARRAWEQHIVVPQPEAAPDEADGAADTGLGFLHGAPLADAPTGHRHSLLGTVLGPPYTGLLLEPVTPQLGEFFGAQSGVGLLVRSVDANSPGMAAGLRAGDVVIKVNQAPMASEGDWSRQMHEMKGQETRVLILRDRREQTMTLIPDAKRKSKVEAPALPAARPVVDVDRTEASELLPA